MKCVFLISCGKRKQSSAVPAKELYISPRFQRARELVEATDCSWFVLSAKHKLLSPCEKTKPYDEALNTKSTEECKDWAMKVTEQMDARLSPDAEAIVILAGERYYEHLVPYLEERFGHANVKIPMKGMGDDEQLKWLKNASVKDILPW